MLRPTNADTHEEQAQKLCGSPSARTQSASDTSRKRHDNTRKLRLTSQKLPASNGLNGSQHLVSQRVLACLQWPHVPEDVQTAPTFSDLQCVFPERSNIDVNSIFASLVRAGGEARAVPRAVRMGRRRREHRSPIVTRRAAAVSAAESSAIEHAERSRWERGLIPAMAVAIGSASRHREPRGVRLGPRRASPPEEATTP